MGAMREPVIVAAVLLALLGVNVLLGTTQFLPGAGYIEIAIAGIMVAIVLWFSMEVRHEHGVIQLFAFLGFFWVAILFGMTMLDYLSR